MRPPLVRTGALLGEIRATRRASPTEREIARARCTYSTHGAAMQVAVKEFKKRAGLVEWKHADRQQVDLRPGLRPRHVATCRAAYGERAASDWLFPTADRTEAGV